MIVRMTARWYQAVCEVSYVPENLEPEAVLQRLNKGDRILDVSPSRVDVCYPCGRRWALGQRLHL